MKTELFNKLDTMFGEYRLKGLRLFPKRCGGGFCGSICRLGRKIASFSDDGFGLELHFINADQEIAFSQHAENQTPINTGSSGSRMINTQCGIVEAFVYHLISVTECLRRMQLRAKGDALIALDLDVIKTSKYGHADVDDFLCFEFRSNSDQLKAKYLLETRCSNLMIVNQDLSSW